MKAFITEFKEFINKGNLLGIAVGFVMGVAVAAVVTALVDNIIMPIVAIPFGKPNFDQALILTINHSQIKFGAFLTAVVSFLADRGHGVLDAEGLQQGDQGRGHGTGGRGRPAVGHPRGDARRARRHAFDIGWRRPARLSGRTVSRTSDMLPSA